MDTPSGNIRGMRRDDVLGGIGTLFIDPLRSRILSRLLILSPYLQIKEGWRGNTFADSKERLGLYNTARNSLQAKISFKL
jgi:hypothetical protein